MNPNDLTNSKRLGGWRGFRKQLPYLPRALRLVADASQGYMILWGGLLIVQSILPVLLVLLTRDAINSLVALIEADWAPAALSVTINTFVLLAVVQISGELSGSAMAFVRNAQSERVRDALVLRIQNKALSLDLRFFETQAYYDLLHRVRIDALMRPLSLLENVGLLIRSVLSLTGMIGLLVSYSPLLPLVLVIGGLPSLWSGIRYSRHLNAWRVEATQRERLSTYYGMILNEQGTAQEVRLFSLAAHYTDKFTALRDKIRAEKMVLARGKILTDLFATGVGLVVVAGALAWMGAQAAAGSATLGDLGAFYQIFRQGQGLFGALMGSAGDIFQNVLFLDDLFTFLDLTPHLDEVSAQGVHPALRLEHAIEVQNISFTYPGSNRAALQNFSLTIPAGTILAIVGENGQGKTTLMKLLCRFYDPDDGRILWDGVDIRELPLGQLRRSIAMLFQTPIRYMETVRHNIAVGDINAAPSDDAIYAAARASSADAVVGSLPDRYATTLGKWFGGEELSVGQWQRIALARAFLRDSPMIILDEPTSAMDSWAENDWLSKMRDHATGRTLVMITHRFTTAMLADRIYVMQNSHIIEQGTHADLLLKDGVYAASWHEQMRRADESQTTPA